MINMTTVDFLKERATRNADDIAFRFLENGDLDGPILEWTFSELYQKSAGVAQDLTEQELSGTSVLLAFPPGLDFVKAFFGCLLAGARAVPVPLPNPRSKNPMGRIVKTAQACEATTVLTEAQLAEMVLTMAPNLPVAVKPVTDQEAPAWDGHQATMEEIAYLQFTSGSTGHPKGVAISHANAVANLRVMGQMVRINPGKPAIVWAPHYHDLCLVGHVLGPVYYGFPSTLMSPLDFLRKPVRWLRAMSHYKMSNTACPNFGYEYAVRRIKPEECEGLDLSNWLIAGNGGEPVLPRTMEAFTQKFSPYGFRPQTFMPCYGMAESVLFVAGLKSMDEPPKVLYLSAPDLENHMVKILPAKDDKGLNRQVVSCGKPGSGHQILAVDPDTLTPTPPNQVGELWVKGPSVPAEYWGLPEESAATFQGRLADTNEGPFLRTGDLGFTADGEVYITGRLKDMIIIAGKNHYPHDIELTVQESGAPVRMGACAAIAVTINETEELVIITEVDERRMPGHGTPDIPDEKTMQAFWSRAVMKIQGAISQGHGLSVRSFVFVEPRSLEKTSSGKPRRRHYKDLYLAGKLAVLHEKQMPSANG